MGTSLLVLNNWYRHFCPTEHVQIISKKIYTSGSKSEHWMSHTHTFLPVRTLQQFVHMLSFYHATCSGVCYTTTLTCLQTDRSSKLQNWCSFLLSNCPGNQSRQQEYPVSELHWVGVSSGGVHALLNHPLADVWIEDLRKVVTIWRCCRNCQPTKCLSLSLRSFSCFKRLLECFLKAENSCK